MGKVASDKCHKWVFKEPSESEPNISNYWQSSFDALPPEWTDQFESGIQTIAVIQAGHGLLQLGSCKIIPEDLHFVLRMRHTFESLGYQSGFYLSHLFSSTRNPSSSSSSTSAAAVTPIHPPPSLVNWPHHHHHHHHRSPLLPSATTSVNLSSPTNFHNSPTLGLSSSIPHQPRDQSHLFLHDHHPSDQPLPLGGPGNDDLKWQNGLSFFNPDSNPSSGSEFQKQESTMDKFKRSFTLPSRMALSSSSPATSLMDGHQHHQHQEQEQPVDYRKSEGGSYEDVMETF